MKKLNYKFFGLGLLLAIFLIPELAMADYTAITKNNTDTTNAINALTKPWIEFLVAWGFIIAFAVGIGGSFAYQWNKAKEDRKDPFGVFVKSVLIAILIAWAALTVTDILIENLTGDANKGKTMRETYWKSVL
jgi:type II secretory pathway component PulF